MPDILPDRGRRGAVFIPSEGRVDRRQLGALLRMLTAQMLRGGVDASSGLKGRPLVQIAVSMGFLGLLFAAGVARDPALDGFLARLFAVALVLAALSITAETDEVRQRHAEVLLSKPIAAATHLASRAVLLLAIAGLVSAGFAVLPLLAAAWRLALPPWLVPVHLGTLTAGAFALALVWVLVIRAGARRLGADRVRMTTQLLLVLVIGGITWSSLAGGGSAGEASFASVFLEALPSTWLARFWTAGWDGAATLRRGAVVVLFLGCGLAFRRFGLASADAVFETTSRAGRSRLPLPARLLLGLARVPVLGPLVLPSSAGAVAAILLTLGRREEAARLRGFTTLLLALGFAAWGWRSETPLVPLAVLVSLVFTGALEGLAAARQSPDAPAAWMLAKSPVAGRDFVRGVEWAVTVRFVLPPLFLLALLLFRQHSPPLASLLVLGELAAARLLVAVAMLLRPALPLAEAPRVGGVFQQALAWVIGIAGAIGYLVAATLAELLGPAGLVAAAFGVGALAVLGFVFQILAAARLEGAIEHGE